MAAKVIALSREYHGHGVPVSTVTLREPHGWMIVELGDPFEWHTTPTGSVVRVENKDAIRQYLARLLNVGDDIINQLVVADVLRIKRELFDFFVAGWSSIASSASSGSGNSEASTTSAS